METVLVKGLELATYGMGTVFLFLTLLVGATSMMSWLILKFEPESQPAEPRPDQMLHARLLAVITAAVQQFRSDHER
jgi:oxaloacetate decarboxylase gamma subunit